MVPLAMRREPSRRTSALSRPCWPARWRWRRPVGGRYAGARGARQCRVAADAGRGEPAGERGWGVYKGSGDQAWTPYQRARGEKKQLLAKIALAPKAKWYGQWIPTNQITGARCATTSANAQAGRPRGARADDRLPPQAVGGGGLHAAADRQGAAGLQEVDRRVRGRDRCRPRRAGAAAGRAVRALRAGRVAAAVAADRVRLARLQRAAQHQRLHRRRRLRLAAQRPGQGAQDPAARRASTRPAASR